MSIFQCCFFASFLSLNEQAHRELHFDYLCRWVWTNFLSNFGSLEGPKMGLFGQTGKNFTRRATLELNFQYESCRGGSEDHFGAKFL